jgi:hypothetical protein
MPHQAALTVRANIIPGKVLDLKAALDSMSVESERQVLLPFEQLPVHFARLFVLDDAEDLQGVKVPSTLVFLSDVDAPVGEYITRLCQLAAAGLDRVFSFCEGYPANPSPEARGAFLRSHSLGTAALYVNTVGRSLQQVRQEAMLREAVGAFLDNHARELADKSAGEIRTAVGEYVGRDPELSSALKPAARPEASWRFMQAVNAAAGIFVAIILLPVIIIALPFYLVLLRVHEVRDKTIRQTVDPALLAALEAREDWISQNQFTAVGLRKPGPVRHFTLAFVLIILNFACEHFFNRGNLAGVRTIHFARWVVIDDYRRVLFASNYDGSLESYMDDFIDKVAFGLNAVFSNGVGYPRTNWLFFDGAKDEQAFKDLLRARQIITPIWYSAYANLTALNVANNSAIRAGLTRDLSSDEAVAWAARL